MDFLTALKISAAAMDGATGRPAASRGTMRRGARPPAAGAVPRRAIDSSVDPHVDPYIDASMAGRRSVRMMTILRLRRPAVRAVGLFEAAKAMMRRNGGMLHP